MKSIKKHRLLFSLAAIPAVTLPLTVISAEANPAPSNPAAPTTTTAPAATTPAPVTPSTGSAAATSPADADTNNAETPKVSENFKDFASEINKLMGEKLDELISTKVSDLRKRANDLINAPSSSSDDAKQDLVNAIYYQKVADYLEHNKDEIIKDPKKYGLEIVYPKVISENEELNKGTITYDGIEFNDVVYGNKEGTNYSGSAFEKAPDPKHSINADKLADITAKTETYFQDLNTKFDDIFINEEDTPLADASKAEDDSKRPIANITFDEKHKGIELNLPTGYTSWDQYIKTQVTSRFTKFDLQTNQSINADQNNNDNTSVPPLIPKEKPVDNFKINNEIENVASLKPYLSYEYYKYQNDLDGIIKAFEEDKKVGFKNGVLKINNPINTRFNYIVQSIVKDETGLLSVDILIQDAIDTSVSRTYKTNVVIYPEINESITKEAANKIIQDIMASFYIAVGVGKNINVLDLANKNLSVAVFNMVYAAIKVYNEPDFRNELNRIIQQYQKSIDSSLGLLNRSISSNSKFANNIRKAFLGRLQNVRLEFENNIQYEYFTYLAANYGLVYDNFVKHINEDLNLQSIKSNFTKLKLDLSIFENALQVLKTDISTLRIYSHQGVFENENDYGVYNEIVKGIWNVFKNLAVLSNPTNLTTDPKENQPFIDAYNSLKNIKAYVEIKTSKIVNLTIGSAFLIIGISLLLTVLFLSNYKKKHKQKNSKIKTILVSLTAAAIIVVGIVLILLAIIGGI